MVGIVEVSLEEPDGNLAPPLQSPFRGPVRVCEMPYLCNLSIDKKYRRRGLGRLLCEVCERIVMGYWEKTVMYLHVETKNKAAQHLYINMGYEPAEIKVPKWQRLSLIFSLFSLLSLLSLPLVLDQCLDSMIFFISKNT